MIEKINGKEIDNLHDKLRQNGIPIGIIYGLVNIESLSELDKKQYNLILLFIEAMKVGVENVHIKEETR